MQHGALLSTPVPEKPAPEAVAVNCSAHCWVFADPSQNDSTPLQYQIRRPLPSFSTVRPAQCVVSHVVDPPLLLVISISPRQSPKMLARGVGPGVGAGVGSWTK